MAEDLRHWFADKLGALRDAAEEKGAPVPLDLPAGEPLFSLPRNLIKSFNLDLAAAGIPKEDERDQTVALSALRHTFGTHLSKNGVAPRTAQAALRSSFPDLATSLCSDPISTSAAGDVGLGPLARAGR